MKQTEDTGLTNIFNYLPRAKTGVTELPSTLLS